MGLARKAHDHGPVQARLERVRPRSARRRALWRHELDALRIPLPKPASVDGRSSISEAGKQALARLEPRLREHQGSYVAVDVDSDEWIVARTLLELLKAVRVKLPNRRIYLSRVGEAHVFRVRTTQSARPNH
jgi:hypothetical protein